MEAVRTLIAIALLVVSGLPFASTLLALAPKSEASLPACCRRVGKHHCMAAMPDGTQPTGVKPQFAPPPDTCPFAPAHPSNVPGRDLSGVLPGTAFFAGLLSHPAVYAQIQAAWRINRERSNLRRGPPTA